MQVINTQFMALSLEGVNPPLMVEVKTKQKMPMQTLLAINHLTTATSLYAKSVLRSIAESELLGWDEGGNDEKCPGDVNEKSIDEELGRLLSEDAMFGFMGGDFILLGNDLSIDEIRELMGISGKGYIPADSLQYYESHEHVIFCFHATNNAGGPTYIMSRDQAIQVYKRENWAELTQYKA